MQKASHATSEMSSVSSRRSVAALTRPPKIPRRKAQMAPVASKRAAVVLRRGMRPLEFRRIEEALEAQNMVCLPVVAGRRRYTLAETPVCGLIVTGGDVEPSAAERELIEDSVRDMRARGAPIIALSNAVELVAEAAALEAPSDTEVDGMMLHEEARFLEGAHQLAAAIRQMSRAQEMAP